MVCVTAVQTAEQTSPAVVILIQSAQLTVSQLSIQIKIIFLCIVTNFFFNFFKLFFSLSIILLLFKRVSI